MKTKQILISIAAAVALSGTVHAGSQADFDKAKAAAQAEIKAAGKVGGEWRDSGKLLKKAEAAAAAGDFAKAIKLANQAEAQGRMGQQQAAEQANAGNPSYLY